MIWLKLTSKLNHGQAKIKVLEGMGINSTVYRKLLPGESLSMFSHKLRKLINQTMPTDDVANPSIPNKPAH